MKKIFITILALSVLSSCDVLDVKPMTTIPADDAFKNKAGIEKGILGAYSSFQNLSYYGRVYLIFSDLSADNLIQPIDGTSSDYRQIDNNAILAENGNVDGIWASAYSAINTANNIIVRVPGMADMTQPEKDKALAELYFIRALNHFNLLAYFGAIPLKTEPTVGTANLDVPRNTVDEVYAQIISDLTFAEAHLGNSGTKVRASQYAATALLARVHLYKGDYEIAREKATDVIENGGYTLLDNYREIFTDGSAESIFEIDFTDLNRNRIAEYNFPKTLNGRREVAPSDDLLDAYEPDDERYAASIAFSGTLAYPIKYDNLSVGDDNVIVLRLAEMYLIRAEAEAKLEEDADASADDLNEVRGRAGLDATDAETFAELLLAIEQERRVEFAFEGHRWFDLVRTNRAIDVLENVTITDQTLYPIPLTEIQTNRSPGMQQNPGY